ncbi:hypothetical protein L950_0214525 [Sphingobacterium sp. IITKGP-BTPF85]|nr:hypothetical protein L950_0214525 [Sphingobacterium sp. IITKGP-BTPF85]
MPAYSIENFLSGYNLPDSEFNDFISFLLKKGIAVNKLEADRLHQIIQSDIEALVGRYYFGREAYFKIKNRKDHFVAGAFRALGIQMH